MNDFRSICRSLVRPFRRRDDRNHIIPLLAFGRFKNGHVEINGTVSGRHPYINFYSYGELFLRSAGLVYSVLITNNVYVKYSELKPRFTGVRVRRDPQCVGNI